MTVLVRLTQKTRIILPLILAIFPASLVKTPFRPYNLHRNENILRHPYKDLRNSWGYENMKTQGYQEKECDENLIRAPVRLLNRGFVLFKWYTLNGRRVLDAMALN
jgi:hypothetical protein